MDILAISESWLTDKTDDSEVHVDGNNMVRADRSGDDGH